MLDLSKVTKPAIRVMESGASATAEVFESVESVARALHTYTDALQVDADGYLAKKRALRDMELEAAITMAKAKLAIRVGENTESTTREAKKLKTQGVDVSASLAGLGIDLSDPRDALISKAPRKR